MITHSYFAKLFQALNDAEVDYAVVGGVAVNFHGYQRFTKDVDLLVSLTASNLQQLVTCLKALGFKPIYPISIDDFLDEKKRAVWVKERNMMVFSLVSDSMPSLTLDLFVQPPYNYSAIKEDLVHETISPHVSLPVIDLKRLIAMKELAGRQQDLSDIEHLKKLHNEYLP